jgi:phage baseplate assembly protein W
MPGEDAFKGTGWSFPPAFGGRGEGVVMVSGNENIVQSIKLILSTRIGERLMHPDFGCDLSRFLFGEMSEGLISGIRSVVMDALKKHEPRIKVNDVTVTEAADTEGTLLVHIDYTIRATNSRFNMVYPFYVNEATAPDLSGTRVL